MNHTPQNHDEKWEEKTIDAIEQKKPARKARKPAKKPEAMTQMLEEDGFCTTEFAEPAPDADAADADSARKDDDVDAETTELALGELLTIPALKHSRVARLIEVGRSKGKLTEKELNQLLGGVEFTPDELEELFETLEKLGI
ncbi:MAG: RNA polymerase sigma factor region1.1 domain-containing protein, partial [Eubacteriales bacterium]|nr:RNA polymerase sigma factor region1.1 domain-containing protein [Eubacteriales bacterium]